MKANVSIDLTDDQRIALANVIDGKVTQRKATRADVVAACQGAIDGLLAIAGSQVERAERVEPDPVTARATRRPSWTDHPNLTKYAEEIAEGIARNGFSAEQAESYKRGWANSGTR